MLVRLPELNFINDKGGKPVGIQQHIGRRPIAAFGNSDGDYEMLAWTTAAPGARLGVMVHHDDAEREFAYDRQSHIGKLDRGLDGGQHEGRLEDGVHAPVTLDADGRRCGSMSAPAT